MTAWARIAAMGAMLRALFTGSARSTKSDRLIAVHEAPADWMDYAGRVSERVRAALDDSAEAALRFRDAWPAQRSASNAHAEARDERLRLKIWIEKRGSIERVEVATACESSLEAALRTALVATCMGAPPPRGMRQPIVMQLNASVADSAPHR